MYRYLRNPVIGALARAFGLLALVLGLVAARSASADAGDAVITLYAQQAPVGAYTTVEFQEPSGAWHVVDGWQGALDTLDSGLRLKQWAVDAANAGQGPFRWVVYASQGGAIWGTSESFSLPSGSGVNLTMTIEPQAVIAAEPTVAPAAATPAPIVAAPVTGALPVAADFSTFGLICAGTCDTSVISVYLPDSQAGSFVAVQYQDANGVWTTVEGWKAIVQPDANDVQAVHWTVEPANFGQGPFRWVVSNPDGSLWGRSPAFSLPMTAGIDYTTFLLRK
jgi:hypothetical protein